MRKIFFIGFILLTGLVIFLLTPVKRKNLNTSITRVLPTQTKSWDPLTIEAMRKRTYPGSNITIEQILTPGSNYDQYIASYKSDGLKIYALLTLPQGTPPKGGWPIIIFNHGYIPPTVYRTTERYVAYVDAFARNGYIVFKPDYRGNGNSEGKPEGAYYSPAYAIDDLNAIASIKKLKDPATGSGQIANPQKIGVWGHSMGGNITLRDLVVDMQDIKAAVIWGGVVGSYAEILNWHDPAYHPSPEELALRNRHRSDLIKKYGTPATNPEFWHSIDPTFYLSAISARIQLDHGESDEEVPLSMSQSLFTKLQKAGKTVELYTYPGSNHNITQGFDLAMQRSVDFFDTYLK